MSTEINKETAVEWLEDIIKGSIQDKLVIAVLTPIFQQAKAMEKEQIIKAVYNSMGTNFDPNMGRAELYYNKTYGKGNI